mmetsp:Transcript_8612/g.28210  ORF Transcript_8612/g.28210 Transcript_8612/m.28210 type:complete len:314 (-) Transcript_8612:139-1080(-)
MQLSGNKVRKLEFLLAEAVEQGCDCIITIGGIQSNHARATAVAARYLGLDAYLILRNNKVAAEKDPGLVGNLLVERMIGAYVEQVTKEEYIRIGSKGLTDMLAERLRAEGRRPYVIPVGGSNSLGTWGYLEAIREIEWQVASGSSGAPAGGFDVIAMACGSGATTAGLGLGAHLSKMPARVVGYGVCDSDKYFYDFTSELYEGLGGAAAGVPPEATFQAINVKGAGYAISRDEELEVVRDVAMATGVLMDPVYSGKAVYGMITSMREDPAAWEGKRVLFVHTGGLLGMYEKDQQLRPLVEGLDRHRRFTFPTA